MIKLNDDLITDISPKIEEEILAIDVTKFSIEHKKVDFNRYEIDVISKKDIALRFLLSDNEEEKLVLNLLNVLRLSPEDSKLYKKAIVLIIVLTESAQKWNH